MGFVEEVLANATEQLGREPDLETWLVCLLFFFENDAFFDLNGG